MENKVIKEIQTCPMVKNIPTGISQLLGIITNEDLDIDELIKHIIKFPVITTRIVMVANSAWAAPKTEILDIKRACLQLGLKMVKSITIALLVSQQFNKQKCKGFDEKNFWLSSLIVSELMLEIEKKHLKNASSSAAYLVGLIHNIGVLVIAELYPDKFSQALLVSNNSDQTFANSLQDSVGISYLKASSIVLTSWALPLEIAASYDLKTPKTEYKSMFFKALELKKQINIKTQPYKKLENEIRTEDEDLMMDRLISKSETIEKLCHIYCR